MTISIQVTINGNYKVPITVKREGHADEEIVISGRNAGGPVSRHITHFHGADSITTVTVGPEVYDDGKEDSVERFPDRGEPEPEPVTVVEPETPPAPVVEPVPVPDDPPALMPLPPDTPDAA